MFEAFEPAEKRLELRLPPGAPSLLGRERALWTAVVGAARAEIVRERHADFGSAYLLSESSLFVFADRLVMLTCGRSTLARAGLALIDALGAASLASLAFERRRELYTESQLSTFDEDARALSLRLPGEVSAVGPVTAPLLRRFSFLAPGVPVSPVSTLELFMSGVAEPLPAPALELDGFFVDEHRFEPSGHSLNALADGAHRALHVTPTAFGTYVGLDASDHDPRALDRLLDEAVSRFRPAAWQALLLQPGAAPRLVERGQVSELA